MNYKKEFGNAGEEAVTQYLISLGYMILERQFTTNQKIGEIDIIAKKDTVLAFIEVKTRKVDHQVKVFEMISKKKQQCIIAMAQYFCQKNKLYLSDFIIRFDIAIVIDEKITYFENAFTKE